MPVRTFTKEEKREADKHWAGVKVLRLKVDKIDGNTSEVLKRWHELRLQCSQICNIATQEWYAYHSVNKSRQKLRQFFEDYRVAKEKAAEEAKEKGLKKPEKVTLKCPVEVLPPELLKIIREAIKKELPHVHSRVLGLLLNKWGSTLIAKKSASGSLPYWQNVLFGNENLESFSKGLPIPFNVANLADLYYAEENGKRVAKCSLRVSRIPNEDSRAASHTDSFYLFSSGKQVKSTLGTFRKIAHGEFIFCGSSLFYNQTNRQWQLLLAYRPPLEKLPPLDFTKVAYIYPGRVDPFVVATSDVGKTVLFYPQGYGRHIEEARLRFRKLRKQLRDHYYRVSSRRSKGRKRATPWESRITSKKAQYEKNIILTTAASAASFCVRHGIGNLVFLYPENGAEKSRCICNLGAVEDHERSWPFFQQKTALENACRKFGIQFSTAKVGISQYLSKR